MGAVWADRHNPKRGAFCDNLTTAAKTKSVDKREGMPTPTQRFGEGHISGGAERIPDGSIADRFQRLWGVLTDKE